MKTSPYVTKEGSKYTYYNPTTKNEKGVSQDGRYFPMTKEVSEILSALKTVQKRLGIESEWIFCRKSGDWIKVRGYISALRKVTLGLGFPITNNHALRMALNSYVLIPKGLEAPDRAKLLGHSVETNLRYYTHAKSDEYLDELRNMLDGNEEEVEETEENTDSTGSDGVSTPQYPTILKFTKRKRTPKTAN